jgi:putative transposase
VAIEDLKIVNMTASAKGTVEEPGRNVRQKAGLNRSILNQGWRSFETILAYKL